jgi:glycerol-3-phosphate acyltransferase PlsY
LIGSINFAYLVAKYKKINIQEIGSGNPGSSNVLRALGKNYAIVVLLGDLFKGVVPFLLFGIQTESIIYGVMAAIGHCFPIFYKFKGGKGVATYLGTVVGYIIFLAPDLDIVFWQFFLILGFVVLYFGIFYIFRISAISSLITCTVGSLYIIFQESTVLITASQVLIVVLIFYQHRENLSRLSKGDENKF